MSTLATGGNTWTHRCRADGMRALNRKGGAGEDETSYRYDGQMPVEEFYKGTVYPRDYLQVVRYGLGARGIDDIERVRTQTGTTVGFPIYDGHGNMVATLGRSGTNGYTVGNLRSFDAWGGVRSGAGAGNPKGRYVANLGHVQDDESGLVYMRARYYEPGVGRFVSEDSAMDGHNWFVYANNDPVNGIDQSGTRTIDAATQAFIVALVTSFYASLGEYMGSGTYDGYDKLGASAMNSIKAAALVWLGAKIGIMLFGTEGLGNRIPQRLPFWKTVLGMGGMAWLGGVGIGVILTYGVQAGKIVFELWYIENET